MNENETTDGGREGKLPAIFEFAASRILKGEQEFCCFAITDPIRHISSKERAAAMRFFTEWFKPDACDDNAPWWTGFEYDQDEARVIALLLAKEIAEESNPAPTTPNDLKP